MVQRPQVVCDVLAHNLSQGLAVLVLPDNFLISPELREKLEEHIQKWLSQHEWQLPPSMQESLERRPPQKKLIGAYIGRNMSAFSQSLVSRSKNSRDAQKVRFQVAKESGKNLGPILEKILKDPPMSLVKAPVRALEVCIPGPERKQEKYVRRDPIKNSIKYKNIENTLKTHLGTKSEQISQGLIPLSVRRSWLSMNSGFSTSETHMETRNTTSSKSFKKLLSSSQKLTFLSLGTLQDLEAHVVKFWAKHRWGLPLKVLKPIKLLKSLPIALCAWPYLSPCLSVANSAVEVVRLPGKPSQTCLREVITVIIFTRESDPSLSFL
ncbi:spermatogenesis-associated protein 31 [Nannospalax galili]|uniref:spermatogenesis-associated protein 31 n=1 Tax=Nannospalax galili TaxID=1026970 RepID=UPI000819B710|nr:spermatogenesis-associated protein 31 [Nannospalax galili]